MAKIDEIKYTEKVSKLLPELTPEENTALCEWIEYIREDYGHLWYHRESIGGIIYALLWSFSSLGGLFEDYHGYEFSESVRTKLCRAIHVDKIV